MPVDVYLWDLPEELHRRIAARGGRVRSLDDPAGTGPAVMFWTPGFPRDRIQQFLTDHPDVRWVHSVGAGADHTIPLIPDHLLLTRGPGPAGGPVGEFAVAALLMLARRVPQLFELHRTRTWRKIRGLRFHELHVAVLGHGPIGQTVARQLTSLGASVEVVRRTPEPGASPVQHPLGGLDEILGRSNGLVAACALTPETHGLLDFGRLSCLLPGAFVVNVARGAVVDHDALASLLASGHLGGAVLDTTEPEPLPVDHALWTAPNCLISSHTAAYAGDFLADAVELFCDKLERFARGEPLPHVVDRDLGY